MEALIAENIMIPLEKYPHIPYWFTLRQAIAEIQHSELEISGKKSLARAVLVFDEEYKLLGMVRRRDIMWGMEPDLGKKAKISKKLFDVQPDPNLFELSHEAFAKQVAEQAEYPVSSIMIPIEHTVDYNDHLLKIIYEMNHNNYSMVPVMKNDVVIGVVRTVEVISEISKILGIE